jgi:putative addiction module CopG family antidote
MNVSLTDDLNDFVQKKIENGQYPSEEAVIEAALKRLRDQAGESQKNGPTIDEFIDHEFVEYCAREADDVVTLEDVLANARPIGLHVGGPTFDRRSTGRRRTVNRRAGSRDPRPTLKARVHPASGALGGRLGRSWMPKSKRTSPPSSFSRASKGLPAFDRKPLSNGLRPVFSSDWTVRTPIFLSAIVFQTVKRQPCFQPLHP